VKQMSTPETSVIIPNWNGRNLLKICLASLRRQNYRDFEIIMVDNGSTDGSVQFVETFHPEVRVVKLHTNRGFCAAVNCGIKTARGKYIALLNNDTEADPSWLGELVGALKDNPGVGFCASKMINYYHRNIIDNAGDALCYYGCTVGRNEIDSGQYDRPRLLFSACAGAAAYRKEMFYKTGFFDEDFFCYYEDVDLGMRAQLMGYKCLYVPTAVVYHMIQATSGRIPAKRFFWTQRNIILVHLKNMPLKLLLQIIATFIILHAYASFIYFVKTGDIATVIRVYLSAARMAPSTLAKRREIQKKTAVPVSYIRSVTGPFPSCADYLRKRLAKAGDFLKRRILPGLKKRKSR